MFLSWYIDDLIIVTIIKSLWFNVFYIPYGIVLLYDKVPMDYLIMTSDLYVILFTYHYHD
jgi:hypothetical protein